MAIPKKHKMNNFEQFSTKPISRIDLEKPEKTNRVLQQIITYSHKGVLTTIKYKDPEVLRGKKNETHIKKK